MQYYAIDEICFKDSIPYSLILLSATDKFLYRASPQILYRGIQFACTSWCVIGPTTSNASMQTFFKS